MKRTHVDGGEEEDGQSEQMNQTPSFSPSRSLASHAASCPRTANAYGQCKERKTKCSGRPPPDSSPQETMIDFRQTLEILHQRGVISRRKLDQDELLALANRLATSPLPTYSQSVPNTENMEHSFVFERPTRTESSMLGHESGESSSRQSSLGTCSTGSPSVAQRAQKSNTGWPNPEDFFSQAPLAFPQPTPYTPRAGSTLPGERIGNPMPGFDQSSLPSIRGPARQCLTTDVNLDYFSFAPQFQPSQKFGPSETSHAASQNTLMNTYICQDPSLTPSPRLQLVGTSTFRSRASLGSGRFFDTQMPPPALPQRQTQTLRNTQAQAQAQGYPSQYHYHYKRSRRGYPFATQT